MAAGPTGEAPAGARQRAAQALGRLGWHRLTAAQTDALRGGSREVVLKGRLIEVLQTRRFDYKGERYPLSPSGIDQIVRQVLALPLSDGLLRANERLYQMLSLGVTVTEFMPDGKRHQPTIALVDWEAVQANRWDLAEDLAVLCAAALQHRVMGLVGFVNGLPVVVIEAAPATHPGDPMAALEHGITRQLRLQRAHEVPRLYAYAQLLLALAPGAARYGTVGTPARFWAGWREEQFSDAEVAQRLGLTAPPDAQDRLLCALLLPERLLEFLRLFVLFDRRAGKVVARHPQFFAVRALIERIRQRRPDGGREGGVVWHTTGSGKSFTMVFFARALLLHPRTRNCRVVVVTDRLDLEDQLARNFLNSGAFGSAVSVRKEGEKARVGSGRELARRIGRGSERIVFTLIHKFVTASRRPDCYNPSADLIVLVDEGHRSHGGEAHERMRQALPRAACIAFTGTPLLKREKTTQRFGGLVHAYSLQRAVEDAAVAPLLYEERLPELMLDAQAVNSGFDRIAAGLSPARVADLKHRFDSRQAVYGTAGRIALIAWDIALHFSEHFKKSGLGLKGQLATASKWDAIRYHRCLEATGLLSSAVIMSAPDTPEGEAGTDEPALTEVRQWWDTVVGRHAAAHEQAVLRGFAGEGAPDLLIVVDRLLTGFDEPRNAVLYIDKPLREHGLIQAVARVNRLHPAKRHGLLVDYRGVLQELDAAMSAYQDLEARTQGGYEIEDVQGLYRAVDVEYARLPGLHAGLWSLFAEVPPPRSLQACRQWLMPRLGLDEDGHPFDLHQKRRDDFQRALSDFGPCLHTALASRGFFDDPRFPPAVVQGYKDDLRFFHQLRRLVQQDARGPDEGAADEAPVRGLLDRHLTGDRVREAGGLYLVHRLGEAGSGAPGGSPSGAGARSAADTIRTRLHRTIELGLRDDPAAQGAFSERLQRAIAEAEALFHHPHPPHAQWPGAAAIAGAREAPDDAPPGRNRPTPAQAYLSLCRLIAGEAACAQTDDAVWTALAHEIEAQVSQARAEHSLHPIDTEAAIRRALLPRLFHRLGMERARTLVDAVVLVARCGPGDAET